MHESGKHKNVLVLLIGEVLDDPRVFKTCLSLGDSGADVTVACTNPSFKPEREKYKDLSIIRFPHRKEFFLKKLYNWLQDRIHPEMGKVLSRVHEEVPTSSIRVGIRNFLLTLNYAHFMKSNLKINRLMVSAFAGESFDLVHCNDVDTLFAGNELRRKGVTKALLYDSHEFWAGIGVHGSKSNKNLSKAEALGIHNADYVVTVNPLIADLMKEHHNLKKTPSVVMNCPYRYDGKIHVDDVHTPVRVIYQGKLQAFRGLAELARAFKYIDNGILTFSGYGPLEESLKLLVKSENLTDRVVFTGRYEPRDAIKILADHDIGVLPFRDVTLSIVYSSPNKLFDYAAAGLAIAASNLPFLTMTVRNNVMGELFKRIDPNTIAETLNNLISDHELLKKYKKNAQKVAAESFSWEDQFAKNYPWKP